MPAEGRENPLLKKGNSDAFFREKYLTKNTKCNHIHNMRFVCMDAGKYLSQLRTPVNVLFVDPPRSGCSAEFINSVGRAKPSRIVYISCNPETQVRDIKQLLKKGYCAQYCQPVDMFPHTDHVETVVLLSRKSASKTFIPVTISPKDMEQFRDKTAPVQKMGKELNVN